MGYKLTERQRKFVNEYMIDRIGKYAVLRCKSFSTKHPDATAEQLLRNPAVRAEINRRTKEQAKRLEIKADDVLLEIKKLAFSDLRKAFNDDGSLKPLSEIPDDMAAAMAGIDVDELFEGVGQNRERIGYTKKIKLWDKLKALELLGKHLKLFDERPNDAGQQAVETLGQIVKDAFNALNERQSKTD